MPKTTDMVLDKHSATQGWDLDTQLVLLTRFIDQKKLQKDLEDYLEEIVEDEKEMSKGME
jgi:hypothetical protein